MGGNARLMAAAITMDCNGKITIDIGSGNKQRGRNGRRDSKAIAMGKGRVVHDGRHNGLQMFASG
jgi:hypothetical protein